MTKEFTAAELAEIAGDDEVREAVNRWLARGDGVAVYQNVDLGHPQIGHRQFASFGSPVALFETAEPPVQLPDVGDQINWRYRLEGTYRGEPLAY